MRWERMERERGVISDGREESVCVCVCMCATRKRWAIKKMIDESVEEQ